MARLIDSGALLEQIDKYLAMTLYGCTFRGGKIPPMMLEMRQAVLCDVKQLIYSAPTIDAVPVRRGECEYCGAIIAGYQGIGKSTLAKNGSGYIDLESGNFFADGKRSDDWYVVYGQIAMHLAQQGYRVFVSSHAVVRNWLADHKGDVPLYVVFPSYSLKSAWLNKLEKRYKVSGLDKDYRAWQGAVHRYDDNVKELHKSVGFVPIVIHDMAYSLERLLDANCGADMRKEEHHEPED